MRFLSQLLLLSSCAFQHTLAKPGAPTERVLPPIEDPFYVPKDPDWKNKDRGTILDHREVTISSLVDGVESLAKGYQLLYVTQDLNEKPQASVTTIVVPKKANSKRVISLQNAYDSPDPNCAPSYGLRYGAEGWSKDWNKVNLGFLFPYLQRGPILNIPDYEGTNAAFAVGPQSAYQTLDSIRAANSSSNITGIADGANYVMFGYSGGALATEWATEFKKSEADDLPIVGAVMGGPPTNIAKTYHNVNGGNLSQLNVWAMLGMMNAFPEMDDWMRHDLLKDAYQDKRFLHGLTRCSYASDTLVSELNGTDISSLFEHGDSFLTVFKKDIERVGVTGQHITPDNDPGYPLAFFFGGQDNVIKPISDVRNLAKKWKEVAGVKVYKQCIPWTNHVTALVPGLPWAWYWMDCRFRKVEGKDCLLGTQESDEVQDLGRGWVCGGTNEEVGFADQQILGFRNEL